MTLLSIAKKTLAPPTTIIDTIAKTLLFNLIPLCSFQSLMNGPNNLLVSNHVWNRFDDLEKQKAERSTNGVVGSSGNTAPIAASAIDMNPSMRNSVLYIAFYPAQAKGIPVKKVMRNYTGQ
jgi:hypothetical protein